MSLKKAFGIIIPLCLVSVLIAALILSIANDMYAFVKSDTEFVLTLTEGTDSRTFSDMLRRGGIIKNPTAFQIYLYSKGKTASLPSLAGEWELNAKMSYRELVSEIFSKK